MTKKDFIKVAKALAEPRRFEMFEMISSDKEVSCSAVAKKFPVGQPTISHHIKILAEANLVSIRKDGQYAHFTAIKKTLDKYIEILRQTVEL